MARVRSRRHFMTVGFVLMILLAFPVLTKCYSEDGFEDEDLSFDMDSSRPQIRHYNILRAGSVMAKSVKFESTSASGDKEIQKRLVAYDLDAIFPPYDNVYEHLVIKASSSSQADYDVVNDDVSIGEGGMTNESLGGDKNTQQSDLVDNYSHVDKIDEVDANDNEDTTSIEEDKSSVSDAADSTIEDMTLDDDIMKEKASTDDHVHIAIQAKDSEMQVEDSNVDGGTSQTSELQNTVSNSEVVSEIEKEDSVVSPEEDVSATYEYASDEVNASDIMDGYDNIPKHVITVDENDISASTVPDDELDTSEITSSTDKDDEREEERFIEEDVSIINFTESNSALRNNSIDDKLVRGDAEIFEDEDDAKQVQGERDHHKEIQDYKIDDEELVESLEEELSDLTSVNVIDGMTSQHILEETDISSIAKAELTSESDEDELVLSSSSLNESSIVESDLEADEKEESLSQNDTSAAESDVEDYDKVESTNDNVSNETSSEMFSSSAPDDDEIFDTIIEREDHLSETSDDTLPGQDIVNQNYNEDETDGSFITTLEREINDGMAGDMTVDNQDITETQIMTNTVDSDVINGTDEATHLQQEYEDAVETESNMSPESINSEEVTTLGEGTDSLKMRDTKGIESTPDHSVLHQTDYQDEEDELPIMSSSKLTANDEFVRGLDDLHKFLEEVDPPDELDVGASGLSIQEVLLGQGVTIIRTRVQKSLGHLKKSLGILKSKGTQQWNKVKDIINDNFDINVEEAAISAVERMEKPYKKLKNFVSENRGKLEPVSSVLNKVVSNFKSFFSRFDAINDGDDEDDISFDDLQIKDDDLAEMRRKIMQRYE
eukprot:CAMPEP_0176504380 /NCGR_PEP_ID=MMETSP0200_2-20121128/15899_1 /TAXON_ID=947934 /ORGANISM="Chaetoceros sp., Strain GSL56" /LENGTH=834 /DNA_ID=CAMNT_0017903801 /DNA_START=134 /DNA_END=2638 /DNA_ORIENTATION=+